MKLLFLLTFPVILMMTNLIAAQTPPIEAGVSQTLAKWRGKHYSDVRYKLNITLEKGAPLMKGEIEIRVKLTEEATKSPLILDWRTAKFEADRENPFANVVGVNDAMDFRSQINNEHILIPNGLLKTGENVIKIEFASPIKTSGSAITRYVDKEDNAEYIYSLFVPSDASTAFPVFDQPDLKARFKLTVHCPDNWTWAISNAKHKQVSGTITDYDGGVSKSQYNFEFEETQPISTYVFAFAAGEFETFIEGINESVSKTPKELWTEERARAFNNHEKGRIYVRKSQAEKFKQHAAEVFRLNREGVKFLESYFDYKFPFPKYDLVLIPEFPFGGMEHAGATFLRESSVIFPQEPTKNDFVSRANLIFHEAAHQWFGDTVTMKWFDDLWLKEGFAEFMAYKTLAQVMPEYNAWKIFYERNKQLAYLTDSTRGTTPIYQEIANLSSAKSAYGNIVYRKAPSFLKQAEFYLGEKEFQIAVRTFLKKHEFANAGWKDLVNEFAEVKVAEIKKGDYYQKLSDGDKSELEKFTRWSIEKEWAEFWVEQRGTAIYKISPRIFDDLWGMKWTLNSGSTGGHTIFYDAFSQEGTITDGNYNWLQDVKVLKVYDNGEREIETAKIGSRRYAYLPDAWKKWFEERKERQEFKFEETEESRKQYEEEKKKREARKPLFVFPNYQDYGYGIFLLDEKSRAYVLENIQSEKDDFLRTMMWGALWDSVREGELAPKTYIELVIKNINVETDESTIQTLLNRVGVAMNYYLSEPPAVAGGLTQPTQKVNSEKSTSAKTEVKPSATADGSDIARKLETLLIEKMQKSETLGQRITFYRAFLNLASSENARQKLKEILNLKFQISNFKLKTKDKFDIVTKLLVLGDKDAVNLLTELEKTETSDEAKRYAYAARAGIGTAENKLKFWNDFVANKDISESWIESAFVSFNSPRHSDLTLPYLEKALAELPNLKRNRKIFFVNGWLASFIGGQKSEEALKIVNKFLADNPNLDKDLRLKILENVDLIERSVKIRRKIGK